MKRILALFKSLPRCGVFGLFNIETKECHLLVSNYILESLFRQYKELVRHTDLNNVEFRLVDRSPDPHLVAHYIKVYEAKGWKVVTRFKGGKRAVVKRFTKYKGRDYIGVYLRSAGHRYMLMGLFKEVIDADDFMALFLFREPIPVCAWNRPTMLYNIETLSAEHEYYENRDS